MAWEKIKRLVYRKKEMPGGLWMRCDKCSTMVFKRKVEELFKVCPQCGQHFYINSEERLTMMLDKDSFQEHWPDLTTLDPLEFVAKVAYADKLVAHRKKSGLNEACIAGKGKIYGQEIVISVLDFRFCGASMGAVVGEKLTRSIELATKEKLPLILISCSGGARMEEGALSLMQMAKTSAALARMQEAKGLYISILTNPTTGGVSASYAALGDVIIGEPGALIGFAGPRVISETIREKLPEGFQTSEFLLEHGFLDRVVPRADLRKECVKIIGYLHKDYDKEIVKSFETSDQEEHDAWLQAHETQRIEKLKEENPPVKPVSAANAEASGASAGSSSDSSAADQKSTGDTDSHKEDTDILPLANEESPEGVDLDSLEPDPSRDQIDIVNTSDNHSDSK